MRLHLNKTLKAALIAAVSVVGFTITQAQAADSGSITLHVNSTPNWETGTGNPKTVYEYLYSTFNEGGTLTFDMSLTWNGGNCGQYQELLHVGAKDTGFYIAANGGPHLLVGPKNDHDGKYELSAASLTANTLTPITVTLTNKSEGTASVQITLGEKTYNMTDLTWSSMNWNASDGEKWKYSIGCGASGWSSWFPVKNQTILNNDIVATYTAPTPVEGLVWAGNATSSVWNTTDPNWSKGADPVAFTTGDNVAFDNTADVKKVTLGDNITAGVVTVNAAAYEFAMEGNTLTATKLALSGDNASLSLSGTGKVSAESISAQGKTITIGKDAVLQGTGSGTISGNGTYVLNGTAAMGNIVLGDGWTGTVSLTAVDANNLNFDNLTKGANSTLELRGYKGYSTNWYDNRTNVQNIHLVNDASRGYAWKMNAWGSQMTTVGIYSGTWTGDGTLSYETYNGNDAKNVNQKFTGDLSAWTGTLKLDKNGTLQLTVAMASNPVWGAAIDRNQGVINMIAEKNAEFAQSVSVTSLDVAAGQTVTFDSTTNIANGVTLNEGAKLVNKDALTLGGTVTFGGNAIVNNGTVHFGTNLVFNLDGLTPSEEEAGVHTYTLFSGSTSVDLSTLGVANITLTDGTSGKDWTFGNNGTISWTLPSELEWDNGQGTGRWNSTDTNWGGHAFVDGATAQFYVNANASITEPVRATSIVVGKAGEEAVTVAISAEETGTLTATTLQVDNGSLTTNVTIEGLGSNTVAAGSTWHISADQTIAAGAIDGSVDVAQGKTVTLVQAATAKDLLLGITGQGNIALGTSVSFNSADDAAAASTKATGTLTLKEGVKLTVGNNKDKTASIASFNHVVMEQGAGIDTKSRLVEINDLTVNTDASHTDVIKMLDTYSKDEIGLNLKGTTTLNGNLEINSDWKYKVNIETLAGTGTLTLKGGSTEQHTASIGGGSVGKLVSTSGSVATSITDTTLGALELTSGSLTANGTSGLGAITIGGGTTITVAEGATVSATSISVQDNNKATLRINGSLDVSGNFYAIGCSNTTDIIGSGDGSSLTVGSLDICNFGTNFNLQNITMTVSGKANAGDDHNKNTTHIDLNAGSALNLLGEVTFSTNESKYCTLNVNGGALTAGIDAEGDTTREFQDIVAGTNGGTVKFLNGANTIANLNMTAGDLAVTVGEHATLTIKDATLKSTITGAVTLTGTVDITNHVISDRTDVYTGGETPGNVNGFRSSAGKMVVATGTVTDTGATYMFGGTDVTSDVVGGVYNVTTETDYTHFYINAGTETLSHAIAGATTLSSVVMSGGTLVADGESVNLEIAEGAAVTLNVTEETTISSLSGTGSTLYITGDSVVTLAANSSMTSTIDIGGTATVKMGEHEALGNAANSITVHTGATLDINGKDAPAGKLYTLTLDGGTYANTGSELSWGSRQLVQALVVTNDSKVNAESHDFGLINGGYDPTTLDLGATLEKVGSNNFYIVNSTITGDGEFKVTEGGLFFNYNTPSNRRGTLAADFLMNGGSVGGTIVLADDISVTAVAGGSTFNAAVINGGHTITFDGADDLTVGGVISGEGGIIKDGEGTLTLNGTQTYTGTTVVKGGKLVVEGTLADDSAISVEGDATIDGHVDTTQVGIAANATATFEQGISDASGVMFSKEGGVEVKNTNAEGPAIKYAIDEANAQVTADKLVFFMAEEGAEVDNRVAVGSVQNLYSEGALTLTNVDASALHEVEAVMGDVVLTVDDSVNLQQLSISGATVAVYTDATAEVEGTVTITEALTSGGGTLLANLTVKGGSMLDMVSIDNELATVTLGSELSFAEDGLVSLSDDVIALLNGMEVDGYWDIFQTYGERDLEFVGDYNGAWFDALFNRNGELVNVKGDFQIEATPDHFRLVKNSMVPEPTTGTLSLLALMALAARRRRK